LHIYMTFVAKGQTRPRPSEAANVAFAILRGPDTQMIRFGGARIERASPPDGDRSLKGPIKPPKNLSVKPFLSTSHAPPRRWSAGRAAKRSNRRAYHLRNQAPESSARLPIFSSTAFVSHRENQICVRPPSTTSSDPVTKEESSLARNRAAFAISPASPKR